MAKNDLMSIMTIEDSQGVKHALPVGVWIGALIANLPEDWLDELCDAAEDNWEALKSNATRAKIMRV